MADLTAEFEPPIFKRLPRNDTGEAVGHQAGFVVPKDLGGFFPELPAATAEVPAQSIGIRAILVESGLALGTVETVYQHQTWGGTRSPERRVTSNLKPLLRDARKGDILLIERSVDDDFLYRFTLVKQETAYFRRIDPLTGGKNWGVLGGGDRPSTVSDVLQQQALLDALLLQPFNPFDEQRETQAVRRVARGRAFRRKVIQAYGGTCAMCGGGLVNALGRSEVEAAHIISRGALGVDDVRNGLALCRGHHWAFDQGMISVGPDRRVLVRPTALAAQQNAALLGINGKPLAVPQNVAYAAHDDALAWHRKKLFYGDAG